MRRLFEPVGDGSCDGDAFVASDIVALEAVLSNLMKCQRKISVSNILNADDTDLLELFISQLCPKVL